MDDAVLTPGAERILEAASRLFYERGLHAVGVDAIAAESGVTKRTLYDRFGSKDALVEAYLRRRDAHWWARWEQRIVSAASPRALTVFDAYRDDVDLSGRGCAFLNAAAELAPTHPAFPVIRAHKRRVQLRIAELLREDGFAAADALADHLYLLVEGAVSQQGIDGDSDRLHRARSLAAAVLGIRESTR
jgi:AcrR family transcriptional regulator